MKTWLGTIKPVDLKKVQKKVFMLWKEISRSEILKIHFIVLFSRRSTQILFSIFLLTVFFSTVRDFGPLEASRKSSPETTLDGKFKYYNVGIQDQFAYLEIYGQIENQSGKDYAEAFFTVNFYDKDDSLLESCQIAIQGLLAGNKRDFYGSARHVDPKLIARFTIEFDGSN
ncbi:FxLYD domain-containing protein [Leptospira stimsonii]|uniref:FxLYD domain-containing protein n=1 Tax=Leptospira stimsonii TaxID=2202203 RepID=UPI001F4EF405|nr:FxLYD domain-containing protein [Leptospira stimsonii]